MINALLLAGWLLVGGKPQPGDYVLKVDGEIVAIVQPFNTLEIAQLGEDDSEVSICLCEWPEDAKRKVNAFKRKLNVGHKF